MGTTVQQVGAHEGLSRLLGGARTRVRIRMALRWLTLATAAFTAIVLIAALVMRASGFAPEWVAGTRIAAYALVLAGIVWFARPLARRLDDRRVALYLEERDRTLDAALVSAVESAQAPASGGSPALARRTIERAVQYANERGIARTAERDGIRVWGLGALIAFTMAVVLLGFGPPSLRPGVNAVLAPWRTDSDVVAFAIKVTPGNAQVPRGGDVEIAADLRGFTAQDVVLLTRRGANGEWERLGMSPGGDSARFVLRIFDLTETMSYVVEASGVRSATYTLDVTDLPTVKRIDLELRFPAHTGLAAKRIEDGGDIATVVGTTAIVRAYLTKPVREGRIILEGTDPVAMTVDTAGVLSGSFRILRDGFYHVELRTADGRWIRGSLDYLIDALDDHPPTVTIERPGRDERVMALDEIMVEARAEDDHVVRSLELVYAINGGEEKTVALEIGRPRREVNGTRTFFLEEMKLAPGDLVSYFARARDGGGRTGSSDIYFLRVRPFDQEYRMSEQGQQPGGQQDESPSVLTERQRQIVAATFNLVRDKDKQTDREWREHLATLALAQGRLREQVEGLVSRLRQRGALALDSTFAIVGASLDTAAGAMKDAEERLGKREAREALAPEQRALQQLQRAEAAFREVQVSMGGQPQGGQGGSTPEDLADLFDLEVDRMRNQYETVQRGAQEQRAAEVDKTLEELRRLANRQQRENERMRRRMSEQSQSGQSSGGGGASQREMAEEAEQAARQLERLARETQSPEMEQAAKEMREAADAMRRSATGGRDGGVAESQRAMDRMREAQRMATRGRGARVDQEMKEAADRAAELVERQKEIAGEQESSRSGTPAERAQRAAALNQKKDALANDVAELESRLDRIAKDARADAPDAARRLQEAGTQMRERRIEDKIRYSKMLAQAASPEYARAFEEQITDNLEEAREAIAGAQRSAGDNPSRRMGENLDRARDLVRGLEGLEERLSERAGAREGEQQAQSGERGAESQQKGQQSGQGKQGQQGQQGQQQGDQQGAQPGERGTGGQGMQPGERMASGAPGRDGTDPSDRTTSNSPGSPGSTSAGPARGEGRRQLRRELRQRQEDAEELRRALAREGIKVEDLDRLVGRLRALDDDRVYADQEEIDRLRSAIDAVKAFEFALRRTVEGTDRDGVVLGNDDEVPAAYRHLVEEYYRALARGTAGGKPATPKR